jgi:hypothetical protein
MIQSMHRRECHSNVRVLVRSKHLKDVVVDQALSPNVACTSKLLLIVSVNISLEPISGLDVVRKEDVPPFPIGLLVILPSVRCIPPQLHINFNTTLQDAAGP